MHTRAFCCLLLLLIAGIATAQTPDGETPANEGVCDELIGATPGLYGLCVAFCEAIDCVESEAGVLDCGDPPSNKILQRYNAKRTEADPQMPCIRDLGPCPCWNAEDLALVRPGFCGYQEMVDSHSCAGTAYSCYPPDTPAYCNATDPGCDPQGTPLGCVSRLDSCRTDEVCTHVNSSATDNCGGFSSPSSAFAGVVSGDFQCGILFKEGSELNPTRVIRHLVITEAEAFLCTEELKAHGLQGGWECFMPGGGPDDPAGGGGPPATCNCCSGGDGLGCDDQAYEDAVCAIDDVCCQLDWDSTCDAEAASLCGCCS